MSQIDWQQTRRVYRANDGDTYVQVPGGYMEDSDYREGGRVLRPDQVTDLDLVLVGTFTNAEIDNNRHLSVAGEL